MACARWLAVRNAAALLAFVVCGTALPLQAQRVRGLLTDSASHEPITGGVVTLADSSGKFLARGIAGPDGRYSVPRLRGSRQMHVVRIGYQPRDVAIAAGDSVIDVRMQPVPSVLAPVATAGERICPGETSRGAALELWEQARAGLLAAVVAREADPPTIRMRSHQRTMEPVRKRVVDDSTDIKDVRVERSYVAARPAWAFALDGYMRESIATEREYFAPDEGVLLDPTFAATHCLREIRGTGPREAQVGLAFEPVKDPIRDTIVDISGVIWLERAKLALESVEFRYTNLEPDAKGSGGDIQFSVMPNGAPMITRWMIHSPVLAYEEATGPSGVRKTPLPRTARNDVRVIAYREWGGEVGSARWSNGTTWHANVPRATGLVTDSAGAPAAGIKVWLQNTKDTATTDAVGAFFLPYVFPGIYVVVASDPVLASQGIGRTVPARVGLFDPGDVELRLRMHSRDEVLPLICPAGSYKPGTGVLMANVLEPDGTPAAHARVDVTAQQLVIARDTVTRDQQRIGETDDNGKFVICGASRERPLAVRASRGGAEAVVVLDRWQDEVATITLVLRPPG